MMAVRIQVKHYALIILPGIFLVYILLQYKNLSHECLLECKNLLTRKDAVNNKSIVYGNAEDTKMNNRVSKRVEMKFVQNKIESFDFKSAMQKLNEEKVNQDDQRLVDLIRNYYIIPPAVEPYNLKNPNLSDYSKGQAPFIDNRLNYKENGFFVECGAYDGEESSNTLLFEKYRNWNGVLIEANPNIFKALQKKNRKAFIINACLSTEPHPAVMAFKMSDQLGKIIPRNTLYSQKRDPNIVEVQCFPMYSILLALGQLRVDFFSLDVEGAEDLVLKTIPWDKVKIKMFSVEHNKYRSGPSGLKNDLNQKGYDWLTESVEPPDIIFIKRNM